MTQRTMFTWRHAVLLSDLDPTSRLVLLVLSCHMTDTGESCFPSIAQIVSETGLAKSTVNAHLKKLRELGWYKSKRHGYGDQRWARHQYSPSLPSAEKGGPADEPPFQKGGIFDGPPSEKAGPPDGPPSASPNKGLSTSSTTPLISPRIAIIQGSAVPSALAADDSGVETLARWMLQRIRRLNPSHQEPNWKRWHRELRIIASREGRTLDLAAELFAWANGDLFWQGVILSPGKLMQHWDALTMKRKATGGEKGAGGPPADCRCTRCTDGTRGRRLVPGIGWLCNVHLDAAEREAAHA